MTTLIEEMARAIEGCCMEAECEAHLVWLDCDEAAQAALSVILKRLREPSEELRVATAKAWEPDEGYWQHFAGEDVAKVLRAIADHLEQDK